MYDFFDYRANLDAVFIFFVVEIRGQSDPLRRLINTAAFMIDSKYDAIRAYTAFFPLFWENPLKFNKFLSRLISHVDNNIEQYFTLHTFQLLYLYFGYVGLDWVGQHIMFVRSFFFRFVLAIFPSFLSYRPIIHFCYEYTAYRHVCVYTHMKSTPFHALLLY